MKKYLIYTIAEPSEDKQEIWMALLQQFNFDGFEQTVETLTATSLQGKVNEQDIETFLQENKISFSKSIIPEENWNQKWESDFHPIIMENFVAVRAHFHAPITQVQHEIIITPKMSFGTGHHATTYMMMQAMQSLDFNNKSVLDFGTGTGILAILAQKMGSQNIIAVDNDDWCIRNSEENILANHCQHILLILAENINDCQPVNILLANINRHILLEHLQAISQKILPNGLLLMSGILTTDKEEMVAECLKIGLHAIHFYQKSDWQCIVFKNAAS